MTNKEKIKHLSQYGKLLIEYKHNYATYQKLKHQFSFPGAGVQAFHLTPMGEGSGNPIEADYFRLLNLEEILGVTLAKMNAIEKAIFRLEDAMHRTVLRLRYIDGLTWEKICVAINYEWAWTHRIHSNALMGIRVDGE